MKKSKFSDLSRRDLLKAGAAATGAIAAPAFFTGKAHAANEKLRIGIIPG